MPWVPPAPEVRDPLAQLNFESLRKQFGSSLASSTFPLSTTLPATPVDGDMILFQTAAMLATTPVSTGPWLLKYRAAATTYKWEAVGGGVQLEHKIATSEATGSATYVNLATTGPTVTVPLDGFYDVRWGAIGQGSAANVLLMGLEYTFPNGTVVVAIDGRSVRHGGAAGIQSSGFTRERLNCKTGTTITLKYRTTGATGTWEQRVLEVEPVAVI